MIETELQEFLDKEINLDQARISQGSRSHTYIRDLLANKRVTDPTFPWLLEGDFLSGSYGRGTKLHPLDDIDVMIVLDGAGLIPVGLNTTYYVRGNAENKKSPVHNHLGSDSLLNSHSVLEAFHQALAQSHSNSTIKKNGQAINVKLDSYNLGMVPFGQPELCSRQSPPFPICVIPRSNDSSSVFFTSMASPCKILQFLPVLSTLTGFTLRVGITTWIVSPT
jgi:hypothetical protein